MKKQILFLVTILLPLFAVADALEIDGIYYNLVSKIKEAEVTSNPNNYMGDIIIPSSINYEGTEYRVTAIATGAFLRCNDLHSVIIPNSVNAIGYNAFYDCRDLTSVIIPNSITTIERRTFYGCSSLASITIPESVTTIKNEAFASCTGLSAVHISDISTWCNIQFESSDANPLTYAHHLYLNDELIDDLVIPNNVTNLCNYTFNDCSSLTSVIIPNSVTSIGNNVFQSCTGLTTIEISNSIISIGDMAFENCSSLTSITIPNNIKSIGFSTFSGCISLTTIVIPNNTATISDYAFHGCTGLSSIIIPNSVTSIGQSAFGLCSGLTSIIIGSNVKEIKSVAFSKCPELTEVYSLAKEVPKTENDAFADSYIEYAKLYVPAGSVSSYESTSPWNNFKNIEIIDMPKYILTYMVDGEVYKTVSYDYENVITPESAPTKEGYTFSGWSEIPETMPDHDVIITGSFTINKYKLTYFVDSEEYKSYEIEYGAVITPEVEPEKKGYTFSGWSYIPNTMPAEDVTVIGSFEANEYHLTYIVDGDIYKEYDVKYDTAITPETEPTKEGYTFSGWSYIPSKMPAEDVTVIGKFRINSYTVTYMLDGEVYTTETLEYGAKIVPPVIPDLEDYTIWEDVPETMPAKDIIIYGKAKEIIDGLDSEERRVKNKEDIKIYDLNGHRLATPQKGINIIRKKDGTTRKVLIK